MKTNAIIPIFIPHLGCNNDCVFCNQRKITAVSGEPTLDDIKRTVENYKSTLVGKKVDIAFYGGSFTGLPLEKQRYYLEYANHLKEDGVISEIHLSTRPDYIDKYVVEFLADYGVDLCELGVQSFDEKVLIKSKRGHGVADVYRACDAIKESDIELGIQLMIGLPGDSYESCIFSAKEAAKIRPKASRLYPTVVIDETELYDMYRIGEYIPPDEEEILKRACGMYEILSAAGIYVMRIGLKATDNINGENVRGAYHPAIGSKVKSMVMLKKMMKKFDAVLAASAGGDIEYVTFYSNAKSFSDLVGHGGVNKKYFADQYPYIKFAYGADDRLKPEECGCLPLRKKG